MEISLRDIKRVRVHDFVYTLKNWRTTFTVFEKFAVTIILLLVIATSWRWAVAANSNNSGLPANGGTFIEGVVTNNLDSIDLGRLTKAGLIRLDEKGNVLPDLASKWEVSADKTDYKFTLNAKVSSSEITDVLKNNPTYLPSGVTAEATDLSTVDLKLSNPDSQILQELSKPVFPHGPYKVDKKNSNEIRLKLNPDYHLQKPHFDRFIVRQYNNASDLQKAADHGSITGSIDLNNIPAGWQSQKITLNKKHILFVNSSKTYLKATKNREMLLNGQKPDGIESLDVLEVNGETVDPEYTALKDKLTQAGVKLNVRKVSLKDALLSDLPKRNYDLLYILINEGSTSDPYLLFHSDSRSETGQNFAELANADIDKLAEDYRNTDDPAQKQDILNKINDLVNKEKVVVEYKNLESNYAVSPRIKGFLLGSNLSSEVDRFNFVSSWYLVQTLF